MRRAVANTMGSMTISPASKKIGKPKISEATPGANGARFSPNIRISASASDCAPPDVSTKRPSIAPRPTRSATPPSVPPKFLTSTSLTMLPVGKPVAKAVSRLTMTSVSSAWMRNLTIKIRMRMIAAAEMPNRVCADSVCVQPSICKAFLCNKSTKLSGFFKLCENDSTNRAVSCLSEVIFLFI